MKKQKGRREGEQRWDKSKKIKGRGKWMKGILEERKRKGKRETWRKGKWEEEKKEERKREVVGRATALEHESESET